MILRPTALYNAIRANKPGTVELMEMDSHINDETFAVAAAEKLLAMFEGKSHTEAQRHRGSPDSGVVSDGSRVQEQ